MAAFLFYFAFKTTQPDGALRKGQPPCGPRCFKGFAGLAPAIYRCPLLKGQLDKHSANAPREKEDLLVWAMGCLTDPATKTSTGNKGQTPLEVWDVSAWTLQVGRCALLNGPV